MHNNELTAEDILNAIIRKRQKTGLGLEYTIAPAITSSRELVDLSAENAARTSSRSREELNNITIKQINNSSRSDSEDVIVGKSPLIKTPPSACVQKESGVDQKESGVDQKESGNVISQKESGSMISPAITKFSRYTGIAVQQPTARAGQRPGLKLAISLQTANMAKHGHLFLLTAELKRYDRLREIKSKIDDSASFAITLEQAKQEIHAERDRDMTLGRVHLRGKRSAWIPNALVIARVENNRIINVILILEDEEYIIKLDNEITQAQQPLYQASGQYGVIAHPNSHSPRLADLIAEKFGDQG